MIFEFLIWGLHKSAPPKYTRQSNAKPASPPPFCRKEKRSTTKVNFCIHKNQFVESHKHDEPLRNFNSFLQERWEYQFYGKLATLCFVGMLHWVQQAFVNRLETYQSKHVRGKKERRVLLLLTISIGCNAKGELPLYTPMLQEPSLSGWQPSAPALLSCL